MAPIGGSTSLNGLVLMNDARRQQPIPVWVWTLIAIGVSWFLTSLFIGSRLFLIGMCYRPSRLDRLNIVAACIEPQADEGRLLVERVRKDFNMPVRYGRVVLLWLRWFFLITTIQLGLTKLGWRTGDCCGGWCTAGGMR